MPPPIPLSGAAAWYSPGSQSGSASSSANRGLIAAQACSGYRGVQDEEIYAHRNGTLELVEQRSLGPGDFYVLIPPRDDIHRVRTTSAETSVSIHVLTNDTGCVWRHTYDRASGEARPFRSGYVNVACDDEPKRSRPAT
jgi:predicted metal-dependent enzyme (double-stranded beta helix superfamily)